MLSHVAGPSNFLGQTEAKARYSLVQSLARIWLQQNRIHRSYLEELLGRSRIVGPHRGRRQTHAGALRQPAVPGREDQAGQAMSLPLDQRPFIGALAGSNGAGKTTFYHAHIQPAGLRFVNADVLARELDLDPY